MRIFKYLLMFSLLSLSSGWAFADPIQCVAVVNKNPAWANYDVTVSLLDYDTKQVITVFDLKKADSSKNQSSINNLQANFDCEAHSSIQFTAQYTPSIWSTDVGKTFESNQIWDVSQALVSALANTKNLNFIVNFPADFVGVPDLIEGINN